MIPFKFLFVSHQKKKISKQQTFTFFDEIFSSFKGGRYDTYQILALKSMSWLTNRVSYKMVIRNKNIKEIARTTKIKNKLMNKPYYVMYKSSDSLKNYLIFTLVLKQLSR